MRLPRAMIGVLPQDDDAHVLRRVVSPDRAVAATERAVAAGDLLRCGGHGDLDGAAMALFSTVFPVFMLSAAIRRIGAARTVLIGTIGPVLTIFFGWCLLGEPLSAEQLGGAVLVLAGVWLVSRRK